MAGSDGSGADITAMVPNGRSPEPSRPGRCAGAGVGRGAPAAPPAQQGRPGQRRPHQRPGDQPAEEPARPSLSPPSRSASSARPPGSGRLAREPRRPARGRPRVDRPCQPAFLDCGPSVARMATMPIASTEHDHGRHQREVPDREERDAQPAADGGTRPGAQHRREERQRQPCRRRRRGRARRPLCTRSRRGARAASAGPMRHARRPDGRPRRARARPGRRARRRRSGRRRGTRRRRTARRPGRARRPRPGVSVSTLQAPPRAGSAGDHGADPAPSTSGARWRMRTAARNGAHAPPGPRPAGGVVGDERSRPRAGSSRVSRSSRRPSDDGVGRGVDAATRSAARPAPRRGPCAGPR